MTPTRTRQRLVRPVGLGLATVALLGGLATASHAVTPAADIHATVDTADGSSVTVFAAPSFSSTALGTRADGARVHVVCQTSGQFNVGHHSAGTYVWSRLESGGFIADSRLITGKDYRAVNECAATTPGQRVEDAVRWGKFMIDKGYDYAWGGGTQDGPSWGTRHSYDTIRSFGFDCSGLTQFMVYQGAGKDVGGTSYSQYANGIAQGWNRPLAQRQRGDLVFWDHSGDGVVDHVAMFLGDGRVIEASNYENGLRIAPLDLGNGIRSQVIRAIGG